MICSYAGCDKDAGLNKQNGNPRRYCSHKCGVNEGNRKKGLAVRKRDKGYGAKKDYGKSAGINVVEDAYIENIKNMEQALNGNTKSQRALKKQGLTYHYSRDSGSWGEERTEL